MFSTVRWIHVCAALCLPFLATSTTSAESLRTPDELARMAEVIGPQPDELRWLDIPWLTNLAEARQAAVEQQRPIFLWVAGDDPLQRC